MKSEYSDVVIVGAGLSGIGAACHLQQMCPGKRYVILEGRETIGGTWDLFRYPGIRSDSDMHTLGYEFKPWTSTTAIAEGAEILDYVKETAAEYDVERHIRFGHRVISASWDSADASWTIEALRADNGETVTVRCNFLLMCAGYYRYDHSHTPVFAGRDRFSGPIVDPQHWPQDLDYSDKRVVIIGSGATAATLLPAMAGTAAHVVMLQRSPTYFISMPRADGIAKVLGKLLPAKTAYALTRRKNIALQRWIYRQTRNNPERVKRFLLWWAQKKLGSKKPGSNRDFDKHFIPSYDPWDQRLCLVPDGDFFAAIRDGKASVVTDHIDTFTETGIQLQSGEHLDADIIITATGLDLLVLGGIRIEVDGEAIDLAETFTYKGVMTSGVPNLVSTFGYINASWTLRADLIAEYACRVINYLDESGRRQCMPLLREEDRNMIALPWISQFSSGYLQRVLPELPKQGDREPWTNWQDYNLDRQRFRSDPLEDGVLTFSNPARHAPRSAD
ncbi:MAG: NAD(P)/FAD-dependent oxidoreductase [Gammaproteobacteria bacterium]|nr:NAD(P)/FAD-dependent oxidoreductase [Gammaproteobacteria bacterium]